MPKSKSRKSLKRKSTNLNSKTLKRSVSKINLSKNIFSGSKLIPSFKIIDKEGNASVRLNLRKDQQIILNHNTLSYLDSHIDTKTKSQGGIFRGLVRGLMTSQSMFMTTFTGTQANNNLVCSSFLPGSMVPLLLNPGEKIVVSGHSLLAFTTNLTLNTVRNFRGIIVQENLFLTELKNESTNKAMVWLTSYGGYHKLDIPAGKSTKIAHGLFLATNDLNNYSMSRLGSVKTTLLGTTSIMMNFTGPCTVYCHTRNYNYLVHDIQKYLNITYSNNASAGFAGAFLGNMFRK